jgi:hypothetical protein
MYIDKGPLREIGLNEDQIQDFIEKLEEKLDTGYLKNIPIKKEENSDGIDLDCKDF